MARYKVILAYDGSGYCGFQKQRNPAKPTIQGSIENALIKLGWSGKSILAAGRTDTGAHALGQVIAFDLDWRHDEGELLTAMNAYLPDDICFSKLQVAAPNFHPRFQAVSRRYVYHVFIQPTRNPLRERYAWRVWPEVDFEKMKHAAELIRGRHDFAAFGTPPAAHGNTIRNVIDSSWRLWKDAMDQEWLVFDITADAFLFRMVRRLVSFFISIGQGKHEENEIEPLLVSPPASPIQGLAPARGLILFEITYPS